MSGIRSAALVFLVLLAAAGSPAAAGEGSSLEIFEALHAKVGEEVAAGRLPESVAAAADDLRFELDKELIQSDAEIEILKLEAARYRGERQEKALDRLAAAAAQRERRILSAVRRLERLAGMSVVELPAPEAADAPSADAEAEPAAGDDPPAEEEKKWRFKITSEPEEFVDDPPP